MNRWIALSSGLLIGCGGANEETLVDELRVMDIVADPPEVAPGAEATLTTTVADPLDVAPDILVWTCTNLGDGCLEASDPAQGTTVGTLTEGQLVTPVFAPAALAAVVADGTTVLPVLVWALACAPGACPPIDLAAMPPESGSADADTLSAFLADPFTGARDLPLAGTSLAFSQLGVSMRSEPVTNPVILAGNDAPEVGVGDSIDLTFDVEAEGPTFAYGYTTLGGFDSAEYDVVDGSVTLTWYGSEEPGTADLWIIVNGEEGGSALWHAQGTVR